MRQELLNGMASDRKRKETYKVCHLTSCHSAYDMRILHKECVSLARAGYEVTCIGLAERDDEMEGVKILALSKPRRIFGRLTFDLLTRTAMKVLFMGARQRADIYHFHDPHLIPVGLILKCFGKAVIYDVHEYEPGRISGGIRNRRIQRFVASIIDIGQCLVGRVFDGVVAANPSIHTQFRERTVSAIVINNYPLLHEIATETRSAEPHCEPLVAYIGFISKARGIIELIQALEHTDAGLLLCGTFGTEQLRMECESLAGWRKVQYFGQVDRATMAAVLGRAQAGLVPFLAHPNHFEARPNKIFEYMSVGLPVIASDFPDWRTLIEAPGCGFCVNPNDPVSIGKTIQKVTADRRMGREMGERGRKRVVTKYNWGVEEKELLALYSALIERSGHLKCVGASLCGRDG